MVFINKNTMLENEEGSEREGKLMDFSPFPHRAGTGG